MSDLLPVYESHVTALNDLCATINSWATSKGWNEGEDSVQRKASDIALMHSELSECLEFVRKKVEQHCPECGSIELHSAQNLGYEGWLVCNHCCYRFQPQPAFDDHVPSLTGEAVELADVLIRIFHYCGRRGIDLGEAVRLKHEYNLSRPYRHGKTL